MHFQPKLPYHVYNRGHEQQPVFFQSDNYLFFLKKVRREWLPYCDLLAWCLMPNHFHFIIVPKSAGCTYLKQKGQEVHLQQLSYTIGKTLSSYTRAINKAQNRKANLFQKKTKAKCLFQEGVENTAANYLFQCFAYLHFNPVEAGLVASPVAWPFCSAPDYLGTRAGTLCNKELLFELGGFSENDVRNASGYDQEVMEEWWKE